MDIYGGDLNASNLADQLRTLANLLHEINDIADIIVYLNNISPAEKELMHEVTIMAKLLLVMPATNTLQSIAQVVCCTKQIFTKD